MCLDCALEQDLHCPHCGECGEDVTICPECGEVCSGCADEWCEDCGSCADCCICTPCGSSSGHGETEVRNAKDATCTEDGYTGDTYCKVCGNLVAKGKVIKAHGHTPVTLPGKAPTCDEDGLTPGSYCSLCKTIVDAQEVIPAAGHDYTTGICPACGEIGYKLNGAELALGSDLTMNYYATLSGEFTSAVMSFTMNGETVTVAGVLTDSGEYVFAFKGIAPQYMNDEIIAELVLGDSVLAVKDEYSVVSYAANLLSKFSEDDALRTLLADLLAYGEASQVYFDHDADRPISVEGLTPSDRDVTDDGGRFIGEELSETAYMIASGLSFGYRNAFYVRIQAADPSVIAVTVDGLYVHLTQLDDGTLRASAPTLSVTDFDRVFTVILWENGEAVQTLRYSLNAFCASVSPESAVAALARAVYNYGVSSEAYAARG